MIGAEHEVHESAERSRQMRIGAVGRGARSPRTLPRGSGRPPASPDDAPFTAASARRQPPKPPLGGKYHGHHRGFLLEFHLSAMLLLSMLWLQFFLAICLHPIFQASRKGQAQLWKPLDG